jgi:DNA polymerase alpha subunit A
LNHFIEYVICLQVGSESGNNPTNLANKAFSPDELLHSKGNLKIDIDWYSSNQLLPPITRLIEHIDGIEVDFVAQCLGVDPKKYKFTMKQDDENQQQDTMVPSAVLKTETFKSLEDRAAAKLRIVCPACIA